MKNMTNHGKHPLFDDWFELCYARLALQLGLNYSYVDISGANNNAISFHLAESRKGFCN